MRCCRQESNQRNRRIVGAVASLIGFAVAVSSCGGSSPPDDLAFRTAPTAVVGTTVSQIDQLPLNDRLVLAKEGSIDSVPVATAVPGSEVVRAPIVVSVDDVSPGETLPAAFSGLSNESAVTAGFVVFHPPSCGFGWITDPSGDSWRVAGESAGSFEPPDDWWPALTTTDDVRLVATTGEFGTIFVRPDGVATAVEYRSTPARVICH